MTEDLMALYSRRLLALAADIPRLGRLEGASGRASRRSPQCGSTVTSFVITKDGRIVDFAQEVRACALGQASASVLGGAIIGQSIADLGTARDALHAMLTAGGPPPEGAFAAAEALLPARDFANRHASIMLAWDAALAASKGEA